MSDRASTFDLLKILVESKAECLIYAPDENTVEVIWYEVGLGAKILALIQNTKEQLS